MSRNTMKFTVVFEEIRDRGYIARVPALPGCETHGETLEHAEGLVRDQIRATLARLKSYGDPVPSDLCELVQFVVVEAPA